MNEATLPGKAFQHFRISVYKDVCKDSRSTRNLKCPRQKEQCCSTGVSLTQQLSGGASSLTWMQKCYIRIPEWAFLEVRAFTGSTSDSSMIVGNPEKNPDLCSSPNLRPILRIGKVSKCSPKSYHFFRYSDNAKLVTFSCHLFCKILWE